MPAHMVNAYYNPQKNLIVFPAAILQAPFYDLHQSSSATTVVLGQLLPMKFPTPLIPTELPSMKMVVSRTGGQRATMLPSRRKRKKLLTNLMDKILMGATINGKLTVSENVADLGGIAAALEAAKREPDFSAEEFFYNFGRIWRMKGRPEFMKLWLVSMCMHQLNSVSMCKYQTSMISLQPMMSKKAIGMWRSPEERDYLVRQKSSHREKGIQSRFYT